MHILSLLVEHYGKKVTQWELMTTGRINRNFRLMDQDGKEYCLKVYSESVLEKRLQDGLEVTSYLSPLGFPVPRVVHTKQNQAVLHTAQGRYLLLYFLPGRNLLRHEVGTAECYGMGAMLGKLHHSLRFFPNADRLHDSLWRGSKESLPRIYDLLKLAQAKPVLDDFDRFVIESMTYRIQVMQSAEVGPEQFLHLKRQALHGDYHLGNVLFDLKGAVSGVLDFDQTCYSFPAWELMRAIGFTCFDSGQFNYTLASAVVKGYMDSGGSLSPSDYLEMPRLWYYQLVRGLFGFSDHYAGHPDPRQDEAAYSRHNTMVWLGDNLKNVRDFLWDTTRS